MKKYIKMIIAGIIFLSLLVVSLVLIKPKELYFIDFNGERFFSTDNITYSYENKVIEYERQDNTVFITTNFSDVKTTFVEDKNWWIFEVDKKIFDVKYEDNNYIYNSKSSEEIKIMNNYMSIIFTKGPINNDSINVVVQKLICGFMTLFFSISLLFIIDSDLFEKLFKKNRLLYLSSFLCLLTVSSILYFTILIK